MITAHLLLLLAAAALSAETVSAQYQEWQHSGSVYILTTPEGANLPATALEHDFPLLVRLNKDFFDFSQAKANGEDIRFSSEGKPLAYQVEEWDAAKGVASIWVRIPVIKGNARQEIRLHWGKADAASESSGAAVFNESNGYLSVWHMNGPVKDEVGTLLMLGARRTRLSWSLISRWSGPMCWRSSSIWMGKKAGSTPAVSPATCSPSN